MVLIQERSFSNQASNGCQPKTHFTVIDIGPVGDGKENQKSSYINNNDDIVISVPEDLPPVDNVDVTKYKLRNYKEEKDLNDAIQASGKFFSKLLKFYETPEKI